MISELIEKLKALQSFAQRKLSLPVTELVEMYWVGYEQGVKDAIELAASVGEVDGEQ